MTNYCVPIIRGRDKNRIILFGEKDVIMQLVLLFKKKGTYVNEYVSEDVIGGMKRVYLSDLSDLNTREYLLVIASENNQGKYIQLATDYKLKYYTLEMLSHFYDDAPLTPCHMKMMSIDSNGDIYPCCKIVDEIRIGNICDKDIISKIKHYGNNQCSCSLARLRPATEDEFLNGIERLSLELCGPCQANCTYCYEKAYKSYTAPFEYMEELEKFINGVNCKQIVAFGGELLCQKNALNMFKRIKENNINIKIDIPTNGSFNPDILDSIEDIFNEFEISFSGFSCSTYKTIMSLDFDKTKCFVYELDKRQNNPYVLKMLLSPICIAEMNDFLRWSLSLNPSHIVFHIADVYKSPSQKLSADKWEGDSFLGKNDLYWEPLLERIKSEFEKTVIENKELIIAKGIRLVIQKKVLYLLDISDDFWENNGLIDNFGAKSTMILNGV